MSDALDNNSLAFFGIGSAMRKRAWLRRVGLGLLLLGAACGWFFWWCLPGTHNVSQDTELPVRFVQDLIYAVPVTREGTELKLLTDTGGGLFLSQDCAKRCGLKPVSVFGTKLTRLPVFRADAWIPEATGAEKWMPLGSVGNDGMLGQRWFAGGVWTFDYPARKLVLRRPLYAPPPEAASHAAPLGFRQKWGIRIANHPGFAVRIAGQRVDALLDTGATVWLSPEAQRIINDAGPAERATSFVSGDLFERWRRDHPEWRVIEKGCQKTGEAMMEVPEVEVAGWKAGPVWFTRRPPGSFKWMSSFMDRPIAASIGGNFLRFFRITIDYPAAAAYFERPK